MSIKSVKCFHCNVKTAFQSYTDAKNHPCPNCGERGFIEKRRKGKAHIEMTAMAHPKTPEYVEERKDYMVSLVDGIAQMLEESDVDVTSKRTYQAGQQFIGTISTKGYVIVVNERDWTEAEFYDEEPTKRDTTDN